MAVPHEECQLAVMYARLATLQHKIPLVTLAILAVVYAPIVLTKHVQNATIPTYCSPKQIPVILSVHLDSLKTTERVKLRRI